MKSRLPAAFVVTFSSLAGGCHDAAPTQEPPEEPHWNPPPQEQLITDAAASNARDGDAGASMDAGPQVEPLMWNPPGPPARRSFNPIDPKTNLTITKTDHGCQIDPGAGARPGDPRRKPRQAIKCPPVMSDPIWDKCHNGEIVGHDGMSACACVIHGNPPRQTPIACPAITDDDGGT